jgi:hypothetical protein
MDIYKPVGLEILDECPLKDHLAHALKELYRVGELLNMRDWHSLSNEEFSRRHSSLIKISRSSIVSTRAVRNWARGLQNFFSESNLVGIRRWARDPDCTLRNDGKFEVYRNGVFKFTPHRGSASTFRLPDGFHSDMIPSAEKVAGILRISE